MLTVQAIARTARVTGISARVTIYHPPIPMVAVVAQEEVVGPEDVAVVAQGEVVGPEDVVVAAPGAADGVVVAAAVAAVAIRTA